MPRQNTFRTDVVLGRRYQDEPSGIEGVATSIHFYLHACERVTLEHVTSQGLQEDTFDAPRLVDVERRTKPTTTRTGGPARAGETRSVPRRA